MPPAARNAQAGTEESGPGARLRVRKQSYFFAYVLIAAFLLLAHGPLLHTPYFWDETGQFIPAALDLFHTGTLIPVTTVPNVHPPGLMLILAAAWKIAGYTVATTRVTMLLIAAGGALAAFLLAIELSRRSTGTPAFTALALLGISPLFFAQSMLAQLDMPAMALTALGLLFFLQNHRRAAAVTCVALVLVKETGLVLPLTLGGWILYEERSLRRSLAALWFLLAPAALAGWLFWLHRGTGSWFGNQAFASYNVLYALRPDRSLLSVLRHLYYLLVGSGHVVGTGALIWAWRRMPLLRDRSWNIVAIFAASHVLAVSIFGGAALERYLLPVLPLLYIAFAVSIRALAARTRSLAVLVLAASLIAANVVNPVYSFPYENNLAFVSFAQLQAEATAAAEFGGGTVASAFPVSNGLRNPELGYVEHPPDVIEMTDFSAQEIQKLRSARPESLIVFNRIWDPLGLLEKPVFRDFLAAHYGYRPELNSDEIARSLHMYVARRWQRRGLTMQLLRSGEPPSGYDRTRL